MQRAGEKAVQAAHRQAELRPLAMEFGEGAQQAVQIFVRMQGGNGQQKWLRMAPPRQIEEDGSTPSGATRTFFAGSR